MEYYRNQIIGNSVLGNARGIYVEGTFSTNNVIIENIAIANSVANYSVIAGNHMAPVDTSGAFTNALGNLSL